MKSTIEKLQDDAKRHVRRAAELRKRSAELQLDAIKGQISREAGCEKATELKQKAADESRQAANLMKFLRMYEGGVYANQSLAEVR